MNKLQKLVCKLFKIKQTVEVVTFNDYRKCDSSADKVCVDRVINHLKILMETSKSVGLGYSEQVQVIKHVPLGSNKRRSQSKFTYVIEFLEHDLED